LIYVNVYVVEAARPVKVYDAPVPLLLKPFDGVIVHVPVEGKPLNTTLPVAMAQVGCVIAPTIAAPGADGSAKLAFTPVADVQLFAVICKLLYVPAGAEMVAVPLDTITPLKLPEP
jgi:hypothetical protein